MARLTGPKTKKGLRSVIIDFEEEQDTEEIVRILNQVSPVKPSFDERHNPPIKREGEYDELHHGYYAYVNPESLTISVENANKPLDPAYLNQLIWTLNNSGIAYRKDFSL